MSWQCFDLSSREMRSNSGEGSEDCFKRNTAMLADPPFSIRFRGFSLLVKLGGTGRRVGEDDKGGLMNVTPQIVDPVMFGGTRSKQNNKRRQFAIHGIQQ